MPCAESLTVQAYFDGELPAQEAAELERHLGGCSECRALLAELRALRAQMRSSLPRPEAPERLRRNIQDALAAEAQQHGPAPRRTRSRPFWLGAASGAGVTALAAAAAFFLLFPLAQPALDGIVAAHVRSLMSQHPTDVISTDRHTVKPWFAGHADVSPVVADFAAEGYRLLGGRADYLSHQRAAVLVYQHGAHTINVFSWVAERALPRQATRDGYHVMCWQAADLQYCAVSDAGWDELGNLAALLQGLSRADNRE